MKTRHLIQLAAIAEDTTTQLHELAVNAKGQRPEDNWKRGLVAGGLSSGNIGGVGANLTNAKSYKDAGEVYRKRDAVLSSAIGGIGAAPGMALSLASLHKGLPISPRARLAGYGLGAAASIAGAYAGTRAVGEHRLRKARSERAKAATPTNLDAALPRLRELAAKTSLKEFRNPNDEEDSRLGTGVKLAGAGLATAGVVGASKIGYDRFKDRLAGLRSTEPGFAGRSAWGQTAGTFGSLGEDLVGSAKTAYGKAGAAAGSAAAKARSSGAFKRVAAFFRK